jgi:hypothetical protein
LCASPASGGDGASSGSVLGGGGKGGAGILVTNFSEWQNNKSLLNGEGVRGGLSHNNNNNNGYNQYCAGGHASILHLTNEHSKAISLDALHGGAGGHVSINSFRSQYDVQMALNATFNSSNKNNNDKKDYKNNKTVLGGGGGGGGGVGVKGYPGSGGGGGGGVIVIAAKQLVVTGTKSTIEAIGGAGGALDKNGPRVSQSVHRRPVVFATRGGGGGGGLVIVSTHSNANDFISNLTINVSGGQSSDEEGRVSCAPSGRVLLWQDEAVYSYSQKRFVSNTLSSSHFLQVVNDVSQEVVAGEDTVIQFNTIVRSCGIQYNDNKNAHLFTVTTTGWYGIHAHLDLPIKLDHELNKHDEEQFPVVRSWIRINRPKGEYIRQAETSASNGKMTMSTMIALEEGTIVELCIRSPASFLINETLQNPSSLSIISFSGF